MMEPFVRNASEEAPELYGLKAWESELPLVRVGFTGRGGGASSAPYNSFNLALHVGDKPEAVWENRSRLTAALGFAQDAWTCGEQVHGTRIACVMAADKGRGLHQRENAFQATDGLVTNVPGILLTSFYADCVPLYFMDPVKKVVGLAHAGWKGTVGLIAEEVVRVMEQGYGSHRSEIRAAIGPSIGGCCYEVDEAVMGRVREAMAQLDEPVVALQAVAVPSETEGRSMLNLKELNRIIMIKAGILPMNIECTSWCTSCHDDAFFSYRKHQGVTGRMASWIGLKER